MHCIQCRLGWHQNHLRFMKNTSCVFAFVGIQNLEEGIGAEHHNVYFDLDEDALKLGVAATVQYTIDFLDCETVVDFIPDKRDINRLFIDNGFKQLINE